MKIHLDHASDYPKRINPFLIMKESEKLFGVPLGSSIARSHEEEMQDARNAAMYVASCLTDWSQLEIANHFERTPQALRHSLHYVADRYIIDKKSDFCKKVDALLDLFSEEL